MVCSEEGQSPAVRDDCREAATGTDDTPEGRDGAGQGGAGQDGTGAGRVTQVTVEHMIVCKYIDKGSMGYVARVYIHFTVM